MRILIVHNYYQLSGGEDAVVDAEKNNLLRNNHTAELFSLTNDSISGTLPKIKSALNIHYSNGSRQKIGDFIKRYAPDIVHVHNFFPLITPSVYDACIENNIPIVQTLHNYRIICPNALLMRDGHICEECINKIPYKAVLNRCYRNSIPGSASVAFMIEFHKRKKTWQNKVNRFIALSEFSKSKFIQAGLPENKITVKPNFTGKNLTVTPDTESQEPFALFAGRLSEEKGVDTLMDAWQNLPYSLIIAGDGPLMQSAIKKGKKNFHFHGMLDKKKLINKMNDSSFIVLPSICYENFPMVIAEAFSLGIPVLASRLGGMAEIIKDGVNGLHFESGNPKDLADKARWLFEHPEECRKMGENALKTYEEKYTPEKNYEMLMDIYNEVIEEHKRGSN
ncbi:glycosyltransferase family 4 protein [Desulforegula conservatrix]|uniref:glycosyltransferase family 4 protein n=1 Tax=Desulforegula conservatrix TaxID=153026 RepID=UPI00041C6FDD|nr:glycosyltransferase family 4 protein [Desulforegula conservatrix]